MKLRSIRLENVRRFTDPHEVGGIKNGLNVLAARNERGKSTVFDALHAVFFRDRNSKHRAVKSLIPYAGGNPTVEVEIELDGTTYCITKGWKKTGKGHVQVTTGGRLLKQADDAEVWIANVLKPPKDGGPSGLLWVRQGQAGLDQKDKDAQQVRVNLTQSVAGNVEDITGGKRMESAIKMCQDELNRYHTRTGRAKKGGPLDEADRAFYELERKVRELKEKSDKLREELRRRRELQRELAGLEAPAEGRARMQRLEEAKASHAEALHHAEALQRARELIHVKKVERQRARERLESLRDRLNELGEATKAKQFTQNRAADAAESLKRANADMAVIRRVHDHAHKVYQDTSETLTKVLKAEVALAAVERRQELEQKRVQAENARAESERASAEANREVTDPDHKHLEELYEELRMTRSLRKAQAASVTMNYESGRQFGVYIDQDPLPAGERRSIPDGADLEIEGMGVLTIHPGRRVDDGSLAKAEAVFKQALFGVGCGTIEEVRESVNRRQSAEEHRRDAETRLKGAAPQGMPVLLKQLAELPDPSKSDAGLPSKPEAEKRKEEAAKTLAEAVGRRDREQAKLERIQREAASSTAALESANDRVVRASSVLTEIPDQQKELKERLTILTRTREELADAEDAYNLKAANAPDLEFVAAKLKRARSAVEGARSRVKELAVELARLDTSVKIQAGEAVEEELLDTESQLEKAKERQEKVHFEVEVLKRLEDALKDARASARERYLSPVMKELEPLFKRFWHDADVKIDESTLLPKALVRQGTAEEFDVLSGGTQEQIALLVRLAFGRMLAKDGRPAPLILDDAIVYTDDDRIEAVFDTLTKQADEHQIIVLSCRQKAFRNLGGESLQIRPAESTRA